MITYELTVKHFDYSLFSKEHLSTTFYAGLMAMCVAFYLIKDQFARIVIFLLVMGLGVYIKRLDWIALPAVLALASLMYYGFNANHKIFRAWMFILALVACAVALFYPVPGIHNWQVAKGLVLSHQAIPYSMSFNLEKFLIGLFFIWFSAQSLANQGRWSGILKDSAIGLLITLCVLIPAAYFLKVAQLDIKSTNFFWLWALHNLFFVCIAEEAIFRGMIQQAITLKLQNIQGGKYFALLLAAVLFGLFHFPAGWQMMSLSGLAGLFYGWVYLRTRQIEASILVHFAVNVVHFLCFSYPLLKASIGQSPWDLFAQLQ